MDILPKKLPNFIREIPFSMVEFKVYCDPDYNVKV